MKLNEDGELMASQENTTEVAPTPLEIWGYGILFVSIINLSSVLGIIFFPLMKKSFYTIVMRVMIGLAIGSLSGSAIFHLIPKAFGLSHASEQNYIFIATFIWLSIWVVMILECTIKIVVKAKARQRTRRRLVKQRVVENSKQNGNLNHGGQVDIILDTIDDSSERDRVNEPLNTNSPTTDLTSLKVNYQEMEVHHSTLSLNKVLEEDLNTIGVVTNCDKSIKTVAWIVIIGDSLHNFIDGVSIGAGFTQSFSTGLILSLAVICEEFPHELGDFAILINSGLSVKRAILFNFLSAVTCYIGLALGIMLGKIEFEHLIFAFAAGIFLYVSLAGMIPEVAEAIDKASDQSAQQAWLVLLNHHIGIIIGILILYILATTSAS